MFTSATPVSVAEFAQRLITRKKEGKRTLLFLGTRTGGLFGNQAFYSDLQRYSMRKLNTLSEIEKFHECHSILKKLIEDGDLRDPEVKKLLENFMADWLQEAAAREVNNYVAELVKEGFFDVIISANMDSLLEDTFGMLGMRRSQDYNVVNMLDAAVDLQVIGVAPCTIVKVFGELESGNYKIVTGKISWSGSQRLRMVLNSLQEREMLAIGYDPIWDDQVESALLVKGELWYVNETLPEYASVIMNALEQYQGKYLVGISYERFFKELYTFIQGDEVPLRQPGQSFLIQTGENSRGNSDILKEQSLDAIDHVIDHRRRKVFISYSHKDKLYLDRLFVHLKPHIGNETDLLDIWSDTRLNGGEDWHKEIQEAIATTKVAILLVSADFLASQYIKEQELPPLMSSASIGEINLLSVVLSPCAISKSGLDQYHLMNSTSLTLVEMNEAERERVWMRTASRVEKLMFPEQG